MHPPWGRVLGRVRVVFFTKYAPGLVFGSPLVLYIPMVYTHSGVDAIVVTTEKKMRNAIVPIQIAVMRSHSNSEGYARQLCDGVGLVVKCGPVLGEGHEGSSESTMINELLSHWR